MRLYVNKIGIGKELLNLFIKELNNASQGFKDDIIRGLSNNFSKDKADAEIGIKLVNNHIITYLKANSYLIINNYGTGSKMDMNNPGLSEYMRSQVWNPIRKDKTIVGRKKGSYKNIFGGTSYSSGSMAGKRIEYKRFRFKSGKYFEILPLQPSHAVETAINWYFIDWLPTAVNNAIKKLNYSKYLTFK